MNEILDGRPSACFRTTTISNYQRSAVKRELLKNLANSNCEAACYWSAELICSGHFTDLWDMLMYYFAKHVHAGNPKLPIYLELRFKQFKSIATTHEELQLRNNPNIRQMFAEIVIILCTSTKKHAYEEIEIPEKEFILHENSKIKAPSIEFVKCFQPGDIKDLFIPANEFAYHLHVKDTVQACYWVEWIIQLVSKKKKYSMVERDYPVFDKYKTDPIWMVWDIIYDVECNPPIKKIIESAMRIFCIAYTPAANKKRKFLIYYAITLCCETVALDIPLADNKPCVEAILSKIENTYKEIKKNEILVFT